MQFDQKMGQFLTLSGKPVDFKYSGMILGFWWVQEETSAESNHVHHLSTSRAGTSFRKISLSRRLLQGGARHESQFAWGSRAGTDYNNFILFPALCYTINEVQSEAICCPFLSTLARRSPGPNWILALTFIRASKDSKIELSHPQKRDSLFSWSQQLSNASS